MKSSLTNSSDILVSEPIDFGELVRKMWESGGQPDHVAIPIRGRVDWHAGYPVPARIHRKVAAEQRAKQRRR